jgi:hypothetical protein
VDILRIASIVLVHHAVGLGARSFAQKDARACP